MSYCPRPFVTVSGLPLSGLAGISASYPISVVCLVTEKALVQDLMANQIWIATESNLLLPDRLSLPSYVFDQLIVNDVMKLR